MRRSLPQQQCLRPEILSQGKAKHSQWEEHSKALDSHVAPFAESHLKVEKVPDHRPTFKIQKMSSENGKMDVDKDPSSRSSVPSTSSLSLHADSLAAHTNLRQSNERGGIVERMKKGFEGVAEAGTGVKGAIASATVRAIETETGRGTTAVTEIMTEVTAIVRLTATEIETETATKRTEENAVGRGRKRTSSRREGPMNVPRGREERNRMAKEVELLPVVFSHPSPGTARAQALNARCGMGTETRGGMTTPQGTETGTGTGTGATAGDAMMISEAPIVERGAQFHRLGPSLFPTPL